MKKGAIGRKQMNIKEHGTDFVVSHNLYHGFVSPRFTGRDLKAVKGDPQFYKMRLGSDQGFQLKKGSTAIGSGTQRDVPAIPGAGQGIFKNISAYPRVDYYGEILNTDEPSIGACNSK